MQALTEACIVEDSKMYWCVTSPTMKDKLVRIVCHIVTWQSRTCSSLDAFHVHCRLYFVNIRDVAIFQNFCYSLAPSLTHSLILPFIYSESGNSLQLGLLHGTPLLPCIHTAVTFKHISVQLCFLLTFLGAQPALMYHGTYVALMTNRYIDRFLAFTLIFHPLYRQSTEHFFRLSVLWES